MRSFAAFILRILCIAIVSVSGLTVASAQSTATLAGTVTDPSGAVIPGATVIIRSLETGVERATTRRLRFSPATTS